jgi:hypothetical protein
MPKTAKALHLIEKGLHKANLQKVPGSVNEWTTGNWWVGDRTAQQLQGRKIYLHKGQNVPSHIGGEVISWRQVPSDPKRKVFRFRELEECINGAAPSAGWGREKCIIW